MLLAFVIVLMIIGAGILVGVYSVFMPFYESLADIIEYNTAYYGAISSIERWHLAIKYQDAGFEGSWWRKDTNFWPHSDENPWNLWRLSFTWNGSRRIIQSQTMTIPSSWQWNINYLLASSDSKNYNKMDYNKSVIIPLYKDQTTIVDDYYIYEVDPKIVWFNWQDIQWVLRLPPKIFSWFGDDNYALLCNIQLNECDINEDSLKDEKIVNRSLKWVYDPSWYNINYTVLPMTSVLYYEDPWLVDILRDNNIRESTVNESHIDPKYQTNIEISNSLSNIYNPIVTNSPRLLSGHNVLAEIPDELRYKTLVYIIQNSEKPELQLLLTSPLQSRNQNIYPFLEYKFQFDDIVSDPYFTIQGIWKVDEYEVIINNKKATSDTTVVWDFTIIF